MKITLPIFSALCKQHGFPMPVAEYRFAPPRRWRADFAWPEQGILFEIEGGVWVSGRHTRGAGYLADIEKYNVASVRGWTLIRCVPATVGSPATINLLREAFALRRKSGTSQA